MTEITVLKLNLQGEETWRYTGEILHQDPEKVILQALFNREDLPFHGLLLRQGDRFVETFFMNQWYNIFEMHDRDDDQIKGWYCNIGFPAKFEDGVLSYRDLALDLLVYPDGKQLLLDEDEFLKLNLPAETSRQAWDALNELRQLFARS